MVEASLRAGYEPKAYTDDKLFLNLTVCMRSSPKEFAAFLVMVYALSDTDPRASSDGTRIEDVI